jgi:hypothetical protein
MPRSAHGLRGRGIRRGRVDLHLGLLDVVHRIGHARSCTVRVFVGVFIKLIESFIYGIRPLQDTYQ